MPMLKRWICVFQNKNFEKYGNIWFAHDNSTKPTRMLNDEYDKDSLETLRYGKVISLMELLLGVSLGTGTRMAYRMFLMSIRFLGESFDIHCGGIDNIFLIMKRGTQSEGTRGKSL